MEQSPVSMDWLNMIDCPAFCVQEGKVCQINQSAQQLQIDIGTDIERFLITGAQEYAAFTGGRLFLAIRACGISYNASVRKINGVDVFRLDEALDQPTLRAIALSAKELRRPLTAIQSSSQALLANEALANIPAMSEYAEQFNRGMSQLLRLVGNMSDANRYEFDKPYLETRDLAGVFDEIMEKAQVLVRQAGFELQYKTLNHSALTLVDGEMLERAIYNLISNAMKFSPAGSTITASLTEGERALYFTLQDCGPGIPANLLDSIFTRYQRRPTLEDPRHGLGLGLVMVLSTATAHGGTVLLQQPEGKGLRITMSIARRKSKNASLRQRPFSADYAGGYDHGLLELSDSLPSSAYNKL